MRFACARSAVLWILVGTSAVGTGSCAAGPEVEAGATPQRLEPGGRSVLDGVFTLVQAERGQETFRQNCSECHSPNQFRGVPFQYVWEGRMVGELYQLISSTMPQNAPGSLSAAAYTDIVSFFLSQNSYPVGESELNSDAAALFNIRLERMPE
jgi:S-disulfanyl-L-cysteine oxidoreductase SoxD